MSSLSLSPSTYSSILFLSTDLSFYPSTYLSIFPTFCLTFSLSIPHILLSNSSIDYQSLSPSLSLFFSLLSLSFSPLPISHSSLSLTLLSPLSLSLFLSPSLHPLTINPLLRESTISDTSPQSPLISQSARHGES